MAQKTNYPGNASNKTRATIRQYYKGEPVLNSINTIELLRTREMLMEPEDYKLLGRLLSHIANMGKSERETVIRTMRMAEDNLANLSQWDFLHRFPGATGIILSRGISDRYERYSAKQNVFMHRTIFFTHVPNYALEFAFSSKKMDKSLLVVAEIPVESIRHTSWVLFSPDELIYEPVIKVTGNITIKKVFLLNQPESLQEWAKFRKAYSKVAARLPGFDPRDFEKAKKGMLWENDWRTYLRTMGKGKSLAGITSQSDVNASIPVIITDNDIKEKLGEILKQKAKYQTDEYITSFKTKALSNDKNIAVQAITALETIMVTEGLRTIRPHDPMENVINPYISASDAIKQIYLNKKELLKNRPVSGVVLSLPANILNHSLAHYEIYLNGHFKDVINDVTNALNDETKYSIALSVYRLLIRFDIRLTNNNIAKAVDFIINKRKDISHNTVFSSETTVVNIAHESYMFNLADMAELATNADVNPDSIFPNKGPADKQKVLDDIAATKGKGHTTIFFNGHGGRNHLWLEYGHIGTEDSEDLHNPSAISYEELGEVLSNRGNLDEVVILIDSCYSYNFSVNLLNFLATKKGVQILPTVISASNFDRSSYADIFLSSIKKHQQQGQRLSMQDMFNAEKNAFSHQDSSVFVSMTLEEIEAHFGSAEIKQLTESKADTLQALEISYGASPLELGAYAASVRPSDINPERLTPLAVEINATAIGHFVAGLAAMGITGIALYGLIFAAPIIGAVPTLFVASLPSVFGVLISVNFFSAGFRIIGAFITQAFVEHGGIRGPNGKKNLQKAATFTAKILTQFPGFFIIPIATATTRNLAFKHLTSRLIDSIDYHEDSHLKNLEFHLKHRITGEIIALIHQGLNLPYLTLKVLTQKLAQTKFNKYQLKKGTTFANRITILINKFIKPSNSWLIQWRSMHIIILSFLLLNNWDMIATYGFIFGTLTLAPQSPVKGLSVKHFEDFKNTVGALYSEGHIDGVVIFGSRTKGSARGKSDMDVVVLWKPGKKYELREIEAVKHRLQMSIAETNITIHPVDISYEKREQDKLRGELASYPAGHSFISKTVSGLSREADPDQWFDTESIIITNSKTLSKKFEKEVGGSTILIRNPVTNRGRRRLSEADISRLALLLALYIEKRTPSQEPATDRLVETLYKIQSEQEVRKLGETLDFYLTHAVPPRGSTEIELLHYNFENLRNILRIPEASDQDLIQIARLVQRSWNSNPQTNLQLIISRKGPTIQIKYKTDKPALTTRGALLALTLPAILAGAWAAGFFTAPHWVAQSMWPVTGWAIIIGAIKVILAVKGWRKVRARTSGVLNAVKEPLAEYDQEIKGMREGSLVVNNWYGRLIAGAHENWSHRIVDNEILAHTLDMATMPIYFLLKTAIAIHQFTGMQIRFYKIKKDIKHLKKIMVQTGNIFTNDPLLNSDTFKKALGDLIQFHVITGAEAGAVITNDGDITIETPAYPARTEWDTDLDLRYGFIHTHPYGSFIPSPSDVSYDMEQGAKIFVIWGFEYSGFFMTEIDINKIDAIEYLRRERNIRPEIEGGLNDVISLSYWLFRQDAIKFYYLNPTTKVAIGDKVDPGSHSFQSVPISIEEALNIYAQITSLTVKTDRLTRRRIYRPVVVDLKELVDWAKTEQPFMAPLPRLVNTLKEDISEEGWLAIRRNGITGVIRNMILSVTNAIDQIVEEREELQERVNLGIEDLPNLLEMKYMEKIVNREFWTLRLFYALINHEINHKFVYFIRELRSFAWTNAVPLSIIWKLFLIAINWKANNVFLWIKRTPLGNNRGRTNLFSFEKSKVKSPETPSLSKSRHTKTGLELILPLRQGLLEAFEGYAREQGYSAKEVLARIKIYGVFNGGISPNIPISFDEINNMDSETMKRLAKIGMFLDKDDMKETILTLLGQASDEIENEHKKGTLPILDMDNVEDTKEAKQLLQYHITRINEKIKAQSNDENVVTYPNLITIIATDSDQANELRELFNSMKHGDLKLEIAVVDSAFSKPNLDDLISEKLPLTKHMIDKQYPVTLLTKRDWEISSSLKEQAAMQILKLIGKVEIYSKDTESAITVEWIVRQQA